MPEQESPSYAHLNRPGERRRTRASQIPAMIAIGVVLFFIVGLLLVNPLLDSVAKGALLHAVNTSGSDTLHIGRMSYNIFGNTVIAHNMDFSTQDTTATGRRLLRISAERVELADVNWLYLLFGRARVGELIITGAQCAIDLDTSVVSGGSELEPQATGAQDSMLIEKLAAALPDRFSPLHIGRFVVRNAVIVRRIGGRMADSIAAIAMDVCDIAVDPEEFRSGGKIWSSAELSTGSISTTLLGPVYIVRFDSLRFSSSASSLVLSSLSLQPAVPDEQFFAGLRYRVVRFRVGVPSIEIRRFRVEEYLRKNVLSAGVVVLAGPTFGILLNKRLPPDSSSPLPSMPNQFFDSLSVALQIDSVQLRDARITYSELFPYSNKPAVLPFTSVSFDATGIRHTPDSRPGTPPVVVRASGKLADAGMMKLRAEIPLDGQHFRFTCNGTLEAMNPRALNGFLEVSDRIRITSGKVANADFFFSASEGRSTGKLNVEYTGLSIAVLDEDTGSEKGLVPKLKTFMANAFALRSSNTARDKKTGVISYVQKPDDAFMDIVWLSVRSGLQDVVGF